MRGSIDMKGDSNRFLARSEGSGGKNDCGGAANIGLLGFVRKGENDLPGPFCKTAPLPDG